MRPHFSCYPANVWRLPFLALSTLCAALSVATSGKAIASVEPVPLVSADPQSVVTAAPSPVMAPTPESMSTPLPLPAKRPVGLAPTYPHLAVSLRLRALHTNRQPDSDPVAAGVKSFPPDSTGTNFGVAFHGQYDFTSHVSVGATYYGADPLSSNGTCSDSANYASDGSCPPALLRLYDPTLPVYALSTLGEAYADYHSSRLHVRIGNQMLKTPWAQPLDGRMKPVLFQGVATDLALGKGLVLSLDRITRFESRTSSAFLPTTFVTKPEQIVPGALYSSLGYTKKGSFEGLVSLYNFYNISNLLYGEATVEFARKTALAPSFSLQYVRETSAGKHYAGLIDNRTIGAVGKVRVATGLTFSAAVDTAPWRSAIVRATSVAKAQAPFLNPIGGTPAARLVTPGTYAVYYGGIASPYTAAYSGDALFTSFIPTNSMAQRQSAGTSEKYALTYKSNSGRLLAILAHADFDYSNGAGAEITRANLIDVSYFFGPAGPAGFRGLSIRDRFSDRTQDNVRLFGGFPHFRYNMLYFEYNL